MDGRKILGGKMALNPYVIKNGEVLRDSFGVTWSSHKALVSCLCQLFWCPVTVLLKIQMRLLLVDSDNPFPCE